jgi:hypothetical protein
MKPRHSIVTKVLFGALLVACLPRFPEGERGVQCWTDLNIAQSECVRTAAWCLDDIEPAMDGTVDQNEIEECFTALARCELSTAQTAEQCERRTGCIAARTACVEQCSAGVDPSSGCYDVCDLELELCAPWLDRDCERRCEEPFGECLTTAAQTYQEAACGRELLDCVLECYDLDPEEAVEQGECDPGRFTCEDGRIEACVDGNEVREYSCDELCFALGDVSGGCRDGDCSCQGLPLAGTPCERGTTVFCTCSAVMGTPCSPDDEAIILQQCIDGVGIPLECFGDYIEDVPEACDFVFDACTCPWTGDGECDEPEGTGLCADGTDPGDC